MSEYVLELKGITKIFPGVKALNNVQFQLKPGEVHALMGENGAGKSTMMKCLFGTYQKDEGTIILDGKEISFTGPKDALENGVAMVHQELNQALKRSVMDNIWLGRYPKKGPMVDEKKMYDDTKALFDKLEIDVDPKRIMSTMPVSQRQMAEIAKAVSFNSKIIVFDEPTSSLTEEEVEHLFKIINMLRDQGCGIIYISHKMAEILRISDDITVMRDGTWVATKPAKEMTMDEIEAAVKAVSADQIIARLPDGYDSDIGEGGNTLSTGEKQLISFARAVLADPRIFVLDEATSSVDTRTELLIQRAMDQLTENRTSFVIAHRLSTIRQADVILVIDHGKIVRDEQGSYGFTDDEVNLYFSNEEVDQYVF